MRGDQAPGQVGCDPPFERNLALARRLNVVGTPVMLFADGRRLDGYADAAEIESPAQGGGHVLSACSRRCRA
jgi:thiol:disulfide interchange protein DsbC